MKNYVVWTNCDVVAESDDTQAKLNIARCDNPEARAGYNTMHRVSRASADHFLQGDWEAVVWTDPAPTRLDIFKRNWQRVHDLWHSEPCSILYLDSDAMFIKPTEIFDRFAEFRMFNWTDPKTYNSFENFYNAGVRYYPSTMSQDLWDIGNEMAQDWSEDNWNREQEIFNTMFWKQNVHDYHHPELNWQGMKMIVPDPRMQAAHEDWNQCKLNDAHILHMHGSRGPVVTSELMLNVAKQLGITL